MAQIQIQIQNKYVGFEYKGLVFFRNNGLVMETMEWFNNGNHGQGTHSTKMGADSSVENTPNAPKFICPICLPKPKRSGFQ